MSRSSTPMCTCKTKDPNLATKGWHPVEVNKEGICNHCGYYAVWFSGYNLYPKSNKSIGGYLTVSRHHSPGWNVAQIDTYFSDLPFLHGNYEVRSSNENLDFSGVGLGYKKDRTKKNKLEGIDKRSNSFNSFFGSIRGKRIKEKQ